MTVKKKKKTSISFKSPIYFFIRLKDNRNNEINDNMIEKIIYVSLQVIYVYFFRLKIMIFIII